VEGGRWKEEMHIYTVLHVLKRRWVLVGKNRLPMKKSNVRFFHGEPVFFRRGDAPAENA
jgi:hypothetical protein